VKTSAPIDGERRTRHTDEYFEMCAEVYRLTLGAIVRTLILPWFRDSPSTPEKKASGVEWLDHAAGLQPVLTVPASPKTHDILIGSRQTG